MSEAIDKMAWAMFASDNEGSMFCDAPVMSAVWRLPETREPYLRRARAALEAIREPTTSMLEAARIADDYDHHWMCEFNRERCWPTMIDDALK